MLSVSNFDLSAIYQRPVFSSSSAAETHGELSRTLSPHHLQWGRGNVSTALFCQKLESISLMILSYGAEVEVMPEAFRDFVLVQMPLTGTAEVECDGVKTQIECGDAAVLAPKQKVRLLWHRSCEQLILKVPVALFDSSFLNPGSCSHMAPDRVALRNPLVEPLFKFHREIEQQWGGLLHQAISLLTPRGREFLHPAWIAQFEATIALFLLAHQPAIGSLRELQAGEGPRQSCVAAARIGRVEEYILERLFAQISLADLTRVAGVSPRTLNEMCNQERGVPPMILLRNHRLDAIRRELQKNPDASLTQLAFEYGFNHLGRFSAYYRERFGELPSETRSAKL